MQTAGIGRLGKERGLANSSIRPGMTELVVAIEFHPVRLFILSRRRVTPQFHVDVVIELTVIKQGEAPAAFRVRGARRGYRRLQHTRGGIQEEDGYLAAHVSRLHDGSQV